MPFLLIVGVGVLVMLLLQKQTAGAPTAQKSAPQGLPLGMPQGRDAAMIAAGMLPQLLAFGKATLGTDNFPALVGLTPDITRGPGSPYPMNIAVKGRAGNTLQFMADPNLLLKTAQHGDPPKIGIALDPGTMLSAMGNMVSGQPKTNNPLASLIPPAGSESIRTGGMIPLPSGIAAPPVIHFIARPRYGSPLMGPSPAPTSPPGGVAPQMPPTPVAPSPPNPPFAVPSAAIGSGLSVTALGNPPPSSIPLMTPTPAPAPMTPSTSAPNPYTTGGAGSPPPPYRTSVQ